ncbi:MAG: FtsX-like permease family protein [Aggregatilineales bacterium]
MLGVFGYAVRLVRRTPGRTLTYLFGLALAVGLFATILFFVDASSRRMTTLALAPVQLDMVGHATTPGVDAIQIAQTLAGLDGISAVESVTTADFASAKKVGAAQGSPAGRLFALKPSYFKTFDLLAISQGIFDPAGAMISEPLAIAQHIAIGDKVAITFKGINQPVTLPVTAIVDTSGADALFAANEAENTVVADLVFVDTSWFQANLQDALKALPPTTLTTGNTSLQVSALDFQFHIRINRAALSPDPTKANSQVIALRRTIERQFTGQLVVTNNLEAAFKSASSDVLSAKILLIFLGLPGVALAAYLSKFAAELFAEAQRREFGLLRTRGATPRQITAIVAATSVLLAIGGSALGLVLGAIGVALSLGVSALSADNLPQLANSSAIAFGAGLLLTFAAAFVPAFGSLQREITQERRAIRRTEGKPFWQRAYLDILLLLAALVVWYVNDANGGFKPKATETTAVELSFFIFLIPFFIWLGTTLLMLRLVDSGLKRAAWVLARLLTRIMGDLGDVAARYICRRSMRVSSSVTVIALTLSFGVSLVIFGKTYSTERQLDSQYVVGADLRVTPALTTQQKADFATQLMIPGVTAVTGIARDTQALIGAEKNTVYGINVTEFRKVAYSPDSFFETTAQATFDALANTPNGVILSREQADKYNIQLGDTVLMRLYNRVTGQYVDARTVAVGFFNQLSTSSQDSDFILNRDFMLSTLGNQNLDFFLVKTDGSDSTISRVRAAYTSQFANVLPVRIQDINTVINADAKSLTALNLNGLQTVEVVYTLLVISLGLAIFLVAMVNERRREFGAMRALGTTLSQLRQFILAEAATIGVLSLIIGLILGAGLAQLLVLLLRIVFTVPTQTPIWSVRELGGLAVLVVGGMLLSTLLSTRRLGRLKVIEALREL